MTFPLDVRLISLRSSLSYASLAEAALSAAETKTLYISESEREAALSLKPLFPDLEVVVSPDLTSGEWYLAVTRGGKAGSTGA